MIDIAIMGHGVVGSGVAEILINCSDRITQKAKNEINVKYILDLREFEALPYSDKFTKDFNKILEDPSVKIVVEVMGGLKPAYEYVKQCLTAGKSVVTSNKELVAAKGAELLKIAEEKNVNFLFEASVGGGIPILRPMSQCLAANEITEINGILNGTTNFILNKMIVSNMSFDDALALAQKNGFAERNPAADIEGHDACRKICILASLGFGKHVYPEQVPTEGITDITLEDVEYADRFNCVIKLIGSAKRLADSKVYCTVRPTVVSRECILSSVNGVFNAIMVKGDETGDVMFYGKGAGKLPTASAVVADVIDCAKHLDTKKYLSWSDGSADYAVQAVDEETKLYVHLASDNYEALKNDFLSVFGTDIFFIGNEFAKELVFITEKELESTLRSKLELIKSARSVKILHTLF